MSTNNIEKSFNPSAEFRFFIFDAMDGYFIYFKTAEDRDKASDGIIQGYLDDGWDEMVEQVVAGEITHTCAKIDIVVRPPEDEIDEDGHDQSVACRSGEAARIYTGPFGAGHNSGARSVRRDAAHKSPRMAAVGAGRTDNAPRILGVGPD